MSQTFDGRHLDSSILGAREQATLAARFITLQSKLPNWEDHKPVIELVFYMAHVDYELKVLIRQVLDDQDNRMIWTKYLALAIHEAIDTLPKAFGSVIRHVNQAPTSRLNVEKAREAIKKYNAALHPVKTDGDFQHVMRLVRNQVAAHHRGKGADGFTALIVWAATSEAQVEEAVGTHRSQFVEYAVTVGSAVQDLGEDLSVALRG